VLSIKKPMNLEHIFDNLNQLPETICIFARKPWQPSSEAAAAPLGQNFEVPADLLSLGFEYFLEVRVAREVLEVFSNKPSTKENKLRLLIFYAENDAYPDWVYKT